MQCNQDITLQIKCDSFHHLVDIHLFHRSIPPVQLQQQQQQQKPSLGENYNQINQQITINIALLFARQSSYRASLMSSLPDVDMYLHRLFAGSEGSFHEHIKRISISEAFEMGVHSDAEHGSPLLFSFLFCRELSILRMRNILLSQTNRWVVKRDAARSAL